MPKIELGTLMEQAPETSKFYLSEAIAEWKKLPPMDTADAIVVGSLVIASALDFLAGVIARGQDA